MDEIDRDMAIINLFKRVSVKTREITDILQGYYKDYPDRPLDIVYNAGASVCSNIMKRTILAKDYIYVLGSILKELRTERRE